MVDCYIQTVFGVLTLLCLLYKAYANDYPKVFFLLEVAILLLLQTWQGIRLFIGSKGNKLETSAVTLGFLAMTVVALFGNVFFFSYQTFVLNLETYLAYASMAAAVVELLLGLFSAIEFKSLENT